MESVNPNPSLLDTPEVRMHALAREYGDPGQWGFELPLPKGSQLAMGKAILAVAGADGKVSDTERAFLVGRGLMLGTPDDELAALAAFDPASEPVDALIDAIPPTARAQVMYDAVMVARTDGFGDKERKAAIQMANQLGLSESFVQAVEAHLALEDDVKQARIDLLKGAAP